MNRSISLEEEIHTAADLGYSVRWSPEYVRRISNLIREMRAYRLEMARSADRKIEELRSALAEKDSLFESLRGELRQLRAMERGLMPLCPCISDPSMSDGPQQECPVHGDGDTFVGEVKGLRSVLDRAIEVAEKRPATPYEAAQVAVAIHIRGVWFG